MSFPTFYWNDDSKVTDCCTWKGATQKPTTSTILVQYIWPFFATTTTDTSTSGEHQLLHHRIAALHSSPDVEHTSALTAASVPTLAYHQEDSLERWTFLGETYRSSELSRNNEYPKAYTYQSIIKSTVFLISDWTLKQVNPLGLKCNI